MPSRSRREFVEIVGGLAAATVVARRGRAQAVSATSPEEWPQFRGNPRLTGLTPQTIGRSMVAVQALALMEQRKITSLVVVGADGRVEGVLTPARPLAHADVLMDSYAPFLAGLVALLVGLAAGKAWERYKLQEGRWIDPRRARESPHYILGLNSMVAGQLDRAIGELAGAARLQPDALEIELILDNLYREKGQVGRAITIHQQLLQHPKLTRLEHAYILLCLGLDYKRGGFVDRAHEAFTEVLRFEPQNPYALINLQKLHEEQHQWRQAHEVRQKLVAISPEADQPRNRQILSPRARPPSSPARRSTKTYSGEAWSVR